MENNGVDIFSKGFGPKANVIALMEFELVSYDVKVKRFSYSTAGTSPELY